MTRRQELRLRPRTYQPRYWTADMNHCITFSINTSTAAATVVALIILVFSFKPSDFYFAFEKCALAASLALARSHSCLVFSWQTDGAKFNSSYLLEGKTLHAKQSFKVQLIIHNRMKMCLYLNRILDIWADAHLWCAFRCSLTSDTLLHRASDIFYHFLPQKKMCTLWNPECSGPSGAVTRLKMDSSCT